MRIAMLPGDGIGPEILAAADELLRVLAPEAELAYGAVGLGAWSETGSSLPAETLELVSSADATLLGAVTTPPGVPGYRSPVLELRQGLELYANLRPARSIPHPASRPGIDLLLVRENTEGLYAGRESRSADGGTAVTERVITRRGSERVLRLAFERARTMGRSKVTVVHKANVLRETCGLFLEVAREVAGDYPDLEVEDVLVDTCVMRLIRAPESFERQSFGPIRIAKHYIASRLERMSSYI